VIAEESYHTISSISLWASDLATQNLSVQNYRQYSKFPWRLALAFPEIQGKENSRTNLGDCFNRNAATMGSRAGEVEGGSLAGEGALLQAGGGRSHHDDGAAAIW
jgi:hypothetical protein